MANSFHITEGKSTLDGNFSQLENLIKDLEGNHYTDVGVLAHVKTSKGKYVAEYGLDNEVGSLSKPNHPPKRSFIVMPIEKEQDKIAKKVEKKAKNHLNAGDIKGIFNDIGFACESAIQEAFDTRGFGTWKPNAPSTIEAKKSDSPLIDTGLLRASISHRTK